WLIFGSLHLKSQLQVRKLKKQVKKLSPATEQATQVKAS
ncbi:DUF1049 domain-containing protein, partial [Vibrio sinaloensis]